MEYAWEEAEMHKYGGLFEKERKSEIAREIGREDELRKELDRSLGGGRDNCGGSGRRGRRNRNEEI